MILNFKFSKKYKNHEFLLKLILILLHPITHAFINIFV